MHRENCAQWQHYLENAARSVDEHIREYRDAQQVCPVSLAERLAAVQIHCDAVAVASAAAAADVSAEDALAAEDAVDAIDWVLVDDPVPAAVASAAAAATAARAAETAAAATADLYCARMHDLDMI